MLWLEFHKLLKNLETNWSNLLNLFWFFLLCFDVARCWWGNIIWYLHWVIFLLFFLLLCLLLVLDHFFVIFHHYLKEISFSNIYVNIICINALSNSKHLSQEFKSINILNSKEIKQTVNEIFLFWIENLTDYLSIISFNNIICASKRVVVKIWKKYAFFYILKSICENDKIEHLSTFWKRHYLQQSGLVSHKLSMLRPVILKVGII